MSKAGGGGVGERNNVRECNKVSCWRLMRPKKVGGMTSRVAGSAGLNGQLAVYGLHSVLDIEAADMWKSSVGCEYLPTTDCSVVGAKRACFSRLTRNQLPALKRHFPGLGNTPKRSNKQVTLPLSTRMISLQHQLSTRYKVYY